MLRDHTADALRGRASTLRTAAAEAEDLCVKLRMLANAEEFERLVDLITPILAAESERTLQ